MVEFSVNLVDTKLIFSIFYCLYGLQFVILCKPKLIMTEKELDFKNKLEELLKTTPKSVLADQFGISRQGFYKWLKKYGIKYVSQRNKKGFKNIEELNDIADNLLKK